MDEAVVLIDEVDLTNKVVHAQDVRGGMLIIPFYRSQGNLTVIPKQGERWYATRDTYEWRLEGRFIDAYAGLVPGDTNLVGPIKIGAQAIGVTTWDRFTAGPYTLSHAPSPIKSIQVFQAGTLIDPSTVTVTDRTLTWPGSAGTVVIYYQYTP